MDKIFRIIRRIMNSIAVKVGVIGILILLLLIPAAMVTSLIRERRERQIEAVHEISGKWGKIQVVTGPVITLPYKQLVTDKQGKAHRITKFLYLLPENLNIEGKLIPEIRYRGIYKTVLYIAELHLSGNFKFDRKCIMEKLHDAESVEWQNAEITIGLSDMRGIRKAVRLKFGGIEKTLEPGSASKLIPCGLKSAVNLPQDLNQADFSADLSINGSHDISFIPVGKTTAVKISSNWNSPSFSGAYLPLEHSITDSGFSASWQIFDFNREFPQIINDGKYEISNAAFGVKFFIRNDIYNKSIRTVKYAILFILFTFTSIFLAEVISRSRVHPFQYLLTGCAITMFYLLLISISEHISFASAYFISAAAVIILIFAYIKAIFKKIIMPVVIAGIQILLYIYLYVTLQSEDYALLMGSLGLFTVLAAVMFVTRKINWYRGIK